MTAAQSDHIAGTVLIAVALGSLALWLAAFVARELLAERRIRRGEAQWRAWFAALPETEKRAGAERMWDAVRSDPLYDATAAHLAFHEAARDLQDERIERWLEGGR